MKQLSFLVAISIVANSLFMSCVYDGDLAAE